MTFNHSFSYLKCQSCHKRTECEQCQAQIERMLLRLDGVKSVCVNIVQKQMTLDAGGADPDDIEELLEDAGIFLQ